MEVASLNNLSYDIVTLVIILCISFVFFFEKNINNTRSRIFIVMLINVLLLTILDIIMALIANYEIAVPYSIYYYIAVAHFILHAFVSYFYLMYISHAAEKDDGITSKRRLLFTIPLLIFFVVLFTNDNTGWLFSISDQLSLTYGPLYSICTILYFAFYFITGSVIAHIKAKDFSHRELYVMDIAIGIYVASVAIQKLFPTTLIECFGAGLFLLLLLLSIQDCSELVDRLTGLFNRKEFTAYINRCAEKNKNFTVVLLSLDDMSFVNRLFGSDINGRILSAVSSYLISLSNKDNCYYLGNNCFGITLSNKKRHQNIDDIARSINKRFRQVWEINHYSIDISFHGGYIIYPDDQLSLATVFDYVDYMYTMTDLEHRNMIYPLKELNIVDHHQELLIVETINEIIETRDLNISYQTIYSTKLRKSIGIEAFYHLSNPLLDTIERGDIRSIAAKAGLIVPLESVYIEKVCESIRDKGISNYKDLLVFIKLSTAQSFQLKYPEEFLNSLIKYDIDPSVICFEISEENLNNFSPELRTNIVLLTRSGVNFALDDCGLGYSNIIDFLELPFKYCKIGRDIVQKSTTSNKSRIAVEGVISLIKALKMNVIIEGMETREKITRFSNYGVEYMQGYYFSKVGPAEEIFELLDKNFGI